MGINTLYQRPRAVPTVLQPAACFAIPLLPTTASRASPAAWPEFASSVAYTKRRERPKWRRRAHPLKARKRTRQSPRCESRAKFQRRRSCFRF